MPTIKVCCKSFKDQSLKVEFELTVADSNRAAFEAVAAHMRKEHPEFVKKSPGYHVTWDVQKP